MAKMNNSYQKQVLEKFPLQDGEQLEAELMAKMPTDDSGKTGNDVYLAVTQSHIKIWGSDIVFDKPLYSVNALDGNHTMFAITFNDRDDPLLLQTDSATEYDLFLNTLAQFRIMLCNTEAQDLCRSACDSLSAGDVPAAIDALEKASEVEPFHPAPRLFQCILHMWQGNGRQAARRLAQSALGCMVTETADAVELWPTVRLSPVHLHQMNQAITQGELGDSPSFGQLMFAGLYAARRFQKSEAVKCFARSMDIGSHESPILPVIIFIYATAILPIDDLQSLREILISATEVAINKGEADKKELTEKFTELALTMLDSGTDSRAAAEASIELSKMDGMSVYPYSAYRELESWEKVLDAPTVAKPSTETINALGTDISAFHSVLSWMEGKWDIRLLPLRAWALLRLGRIQDAAKVTDSDPKTWCYRVIHALHPSVPEVWISVLASVELLIRSDKRSEALVLLQEGYTTIAGSIGNSVDIYQAHASDLYGFYSAIAKNDIPRCKLYLKRLLSADGFAWSCSLAQELLPDSVEPVVLSDVESVSLLEDFSEWMIVASRHKALSGSADVQASLIEFHRAATETMLRVVVGGETSAGKSSFLNALLGSSILYTTQEEATAIPTHIRHGQTWSATVYGAADVEIDTIDIGIEQTPDTSADFRSFIEKYTYLGSSKSRNVVRLIISCPVDSIPDNVEYIDTPGLNAHELRTKIADDTLASAHLCVFVLDARNALKGRELQKIRLAADLAGKTVFVLNKMDLVMDDDELDCDPNSAEDVLGRVSNELRKALSVSDVSVFAVSSVNRLALETAGATTTLAYADAISVVRNTLNAMLDDSASKLVAFAAVRVARTTLNVALEQAFREVSDRESEIGLLSSQIPDDHRSFEDYVTTSVSGTWQSLLPEYTENMIRTLEQAAETFRDNVISGLQNCSSDEDVKRFVNGRLKTIFQGFLDGIENERAKEWARVGRSVSREIEKLFLELYNDLPFKAEPNFSSLHAQMRPIPLIDSSMDLKNTVESIFSSASTREWGSTAAGAAIGTVVLPGIGTVIGGILGSLFGDSLNEKVMQEVFEAIGERFEGVMNITIESLDADTMCADDGQPAMLLAILGTAEAERRRFQSMIEERIAQNIRLRDSAEVSAEGARTLAVEASQWYERLIVLRDADYLTGDISSHNRDGLVRLLDAANQIQVIQEKPAEVTSTSKSASLPISAASNASRTDSYKESQKSIQTNGSGSGCLLVSIFGIISLAAIVVRYIS